MKTPKVLVVRNRDEFTLLGDPKVIFDLDEVAVKLIRSSFMEEWLAQKVKEHLQGGHEFVRRDPETGGIGAVYRLATEDDVLSFADSQRLRAVSDKPRAQKSVDSSRLVLNYKSTDELSLLYDDLPRQAKVVLDLLNEAKREKFTEAAIEVVLTENVEKLKTKQPPMRIFGFYKKRFLEEGHLSESD